MVKIGDIHYDTIADAIKAGGGVIVLDSDVVESIRVEKGKDIKIDLAGHRLKGKDANETIFVLGKLTIMDSIGGGVVDGVVPYKACIRTRIGSILHLQGGKYTRSFDNGTPTKSWYVIWAEGGRVIVEDGVEIESRSKNHAALQIGFEDAAGNPDGIKVQAFINGGKIVGKRYGLMVAKFGDVTVNGGQITAEHEAVFNNNRLKIQKGTFTSTADYTVCDVAGDTDAEIGLAEIQGGMFRGKLGNLRLLTEYNDSGKYIVSGGEFNFEPPAEYIAPGLSAEKNREGLWEVINGDTPPVALEGGAVGAGFMSMKRLIVHDDSFIYSKGGVALNSLRDFVPIAVIANAKEGINAYVEAGTKKVFLYRNGTEVEGEIKDLTLVFIGNN